jgi:hypothetical protein
LMNIDSKGKIPTRIFGIHGRARFTRKSGAERADIFQPSHNGQRLLGRTNSRRLYFESEMQRFVDVKKDNEKYEIFFYCKEDTGVHDLYTGLHSDVQKIFPGNKIISTS